LKRARKSALDKIDGINSVLPSIFSLSGSGEEGS
jgi:hypothetical protein